MANTRVGAVKIAAKKIGISVPEYNRRIYAGKKWCGICVRWHFLSDFGSDASRSDGKASSCMASRQKTEKERYIKAIPKIPGRRIIPARDDDREQARRRVNYFVEIGLISSPNSLPCADCGHIYKRGERRHEYDHYLGYAAENHERVEAVCTICHSERGRKR